ncbi:MAG: hypothetical protein ACKVUT_03530 [Gaiella sp.]
MIVRCLRIIDVHGDEVDTTGWDLAVGRQYVVLCISAAPEHEVYLRVYEPGNPPEGGVPGLWRSQMFEVLSPAIPSNWRVDIGTPQSPGYLQIAPETWLRPGFWEDLIDAGPFSDRSRADYNREVAIILQESGFSPP